MSSELSILAVYGIIVLLLAAVQVFAAIVQHGLMALAGPRDQLPPITGVPGRLLRCLNNSVVALATFAPAVLLLQATNGFTATTLLTCQIFLIMRVVYIPLYAMGIPLLRTGIFVVATFANLYLYAQAF